MFCKNLQKCLQELYNKEGHSKEITSILKMFKSDVKTAISNPLKQEQKKINKYLKNKLSQIYINKSNAKIEDDYKKRLWFKVGLLFATGKIDMNINNHNESSNQLAIKLGNKNFRPYISESLSRTNTKDKNIFSNNKKLLMIYKHCEENNIKVVDKFIDSIDFNN